MNVQDDGQSEYHARNLYFTVLLGYKAKGGAAHTAKPWPWSAVLWLQRKCGLYLPFELQLYVLMVGWTAPLSPIYDPLAMYLYWRDVWKSPGLAGSPTEDGRRGCDGGFVVLGDDITPDSGRLFVADVNDGTRGWVYSMEGDSSGEAALARREDEVRRKEGCTLRGLILSTPRLAGIVEAAR